MINKEDKNMLTPFQHLNFILNFNYFLHNAINGMFGACYHLFLDGHGNLHHFPLFHVSSTIFAGQLMGH